MTTNKNRAWHFLLQACSAKQYVYIFITLMGVTLLSACNQEASNSEEPKPIAAAQGTQAATPRPNILFIVADDHRWDLLGKYHPIVKTPNLDQLASKGTVFKNAFVTTPICAASRASIMTSTTERTHDYTFRQPPVAPSLSAISFPQKLKESGYHSGFVGKFGIKLAGKASDRFDYFAELLQATHNEYNGKKIPQSYYIAELAKDFIAQSQKDDASKPWVMSVNFWDPHAHDVDTKDQFHYPEELESLYSDITIPPARLSDDSYFQELPDFLKASLGRIRWEFRFGDEQTYQKMVKRHYRAVTGVDKAVGMIHKQLVDLGIDDNTIIIYTGDNGFSLNERQLAGKWYGWEEDLRVPLIIYDPRNKASHGKETQSTALNLDLAPTMLDFAGVASPSQYQGKSLLPLLGTTGVDGWRDEFFFEHMYTAEGRIPPMEGVRSVKWKYVRYPQHGNYEQLYDLTNDAGELVNLAKKEAHQKTLAEYRARTDEYVKQYTALRSAEARE